MTTQLLPTAARAWTMAAVSYDSPAARELTQALQREQHGIYGRADDPETTAAAEFESPCGVFLVTERADGIALACGGWRTVGLTTAEVKRMYVAPAARGQGYGRRLLEALEQDASRHGMTKVILETGVSNHVALALYKRCGYTLVEPYVLGRDPRINRALSKDLSLPWEVQPEYGTERLALPHKLNDPDSTTGPSWLPLRVGRLS
ncbi:GNAT family N-acetyltransferase [Streptomyces sp. NBC_01237]|uniref:GNAT family N-acetyltransferase n=1 Tax=Streptomyces sp. NBC_01237 TaxID=2903790 RepID=UPI002DDB1CDA|nr:GNAT family N-acetyltransferase [Streptomyces sp. NBC_01237]WRZ77216.1 GNAT family N-acetyltransferase [Streptomyces sp. NBC_01237]